MNHFSQQLNMSHISQCKPLAGFVLGTHHTYFLTCENFKVGGHHVPENCSKQSGS